MQQSPDQAPQWIQTAITMGIPGALALWVWWSARKTIDERIEEKLAPVHAKLSEIDGKCERILGWIDGQKDARR